MKILELRVIILQEADRLARKGDLDSGLKGDCIRRMLAQIPERENNQELASYDEAVKLLESIKESVGGSTRERSLKDTLAAHTNTFGFIGGEASALRNVLEKITAYFESQRLAIQMSNGR